MKLKDIINNDTFSKIVDALLEDEEFTNTTIEKVKSICSDNVIDKKDIPKIVNLAVFLYSEKEHLELNPEYMEEILKLLIYKLVLLVSNKYNYEIKMTDDLEETIDLVVDTAIMFVNMTTTSNCFSFSCCK